MRKISFLIFSSLLFFSLLSILLSLNNKGEENDPFTSAILRNSFNKSKKRAIKTQICQSKELPIIDFVYTYVNGSDPQHQKNLKEVQLLLKSLVMTNFLPIQNNNGEIKQSRKCE